MLDRKEIERLTNEVVARQCREEQRKLEEDRLANQKWWEVERVAFPLYMEQKVRRAAGRGFYSCRFLLNKRYRPFISDLKRLVEKTFPNFHLDYTERTSQDNPENITYEFRVAWGSCADLPTEADPE